MEEVITIRKGGRKPKVTLETAISKIKALIRDRIERAKEEAKKHLKDPEKWGQFFESPSMETIATLLKVSTKTVERLLKQFSEREYKERYTPKMVLERLVEEYKEKEKKKLKEEKTEEELLREGKITIWDCEVLANAWKNYMMYSKASEKKKRANKTKIEQFAKWIRDYFPDYYHPSKWTADLAIAWQGFLSGEWRDPFTGELHKSTLEEVRKYVKKRGRIVSYDEKGNPIKELTAKGTFGDIQPIKQLFKYLNPPEYDKISTKGLKSEPIKDYLEPHEAEVFSYRAEKIFRKLYPDKSIKEWRCYYWFSLLTGTRIGFRAREFKDSRGTLSITLNNIRYIKDKDYYIIRVVDKGNRTWDKIVLADAKIWLEEYLKERNIPIKTTLTELEYLFTLEPNEIREVFKYARELSELFLLRAYCYSCREILVGSFYRVVEVEGKKIKKRFTREIKDTRIADFGTTIVLKCPKCGKLNYLGLHPSVTGVDSQYIESEHAFIPEGGTRPIRPHTLRKTAAMWYLERWHAPPHIVAQLCGWDSLDTMMKWYVSVRIDFIERSIAEFAEYARKREEEFLKKREV
jgi:integrase/DNA-binding MarR family transcriptional regulator